MKNMPKTLNQEIKHLCMASIFLLLFVSPLFILGEDAHIRIHDNLDSNIAWYKVLKDSHLLFGSPNSSIPQIINGGLSRNAFGTEFSGIQWLYHLFPAMLAFSISQALTRIFAFLGMYLLLKRHFIRSGEEYIIRVWVSLAFALTPFWPSGMLSTLGMPLALWAFLSIREGSHSWREWLAIILLPLYSSFVLGFFFFLAALGIWWIWDLILYRKANPVFLGSIALMSGIYLLIEYRLVYSFIVQGPPTNRNEFFESTLSLRRAMKLALKNYFNGHTHVMTMHTEVILPLSFLVFLVLIVKKRGFLEKKYLILFILNIGLSFWYAFWFYKGWIPLKAKVTVFNTFNFARFHFLRPMVIYLLFALGLSILWKMGKIGKVMGTAALLAQLLILIDANNEIYYRKANDPTFRQFYAVKQFSDIAAYIGKPKSTYRVASIGLHPAVSQYNGFYTLDTYNNFYPLSYKHEFRKIIEKELDKSPKLRKYYDRWGGRCYMFSAELGKRYEIKKTSRIAIHHLEINTKVFKKLGGQYIFSSVPILNAEKTGLKYRRSFDQKESAWKIYLYQVK